MRIPHTALRSTVSIENYSGDGSLGPSFAAARDVRVSFQWTDMYRMEWKNEMSTIRAWVLMRPEDGPVPIGSRVTYGTEKFRVVQSLIIPDEHSPSHYELVLSEWGVN